MNTVNRMCCKNWFTTPLFRIWFVSKTVFLDGSRRYYLVTLLNFLSDFLAYVSLQKHKSALLTLWLFSDMSFIQQRDNKRDRDHFGMSLAPLWAPLSMSRDVASLNYFYEHVRARSRVNSIIWKTKIFSIRRWSISDYFLHFSVVEAFLISSLSPVKK